MSYYVTNENSVLNINNAHLKVSGNIQTDVMKLGAIEFAPPASDVPGTVNFTNVTTGVTTSSNLNVGGTLMLGSVELVTATAALEQTVNLGNVTSNTVQFTNPTTSLVASGNVVVTGNVTADHFVGDGSNITGISSTLQAITDSGNVTSNTIQFSNAITGFVTTANIEIGTANLFVDTSSSRVGIGLTDPDEKLHVNGNIRLGGPQGTDEDASYYIKSAGQIHINSATDGAADDSYICLDLRSGQSGSNRSGIDICGAATSTSYQHIAFETTDAERMRINYDGNVGIGTTSPGAKLHIGAFDNNHLLLTSVNNDYGWKIDTADELAGEVPFRLYRRTDTVDVLALSVANQNSRVNHTHTEKYNFHYNAATWGHATNVNSTATNLFSTTINFPYDGYIFVKSQGHWARKDTNNSGHTGGNTSFYAWISLNNQESAWSGQYDNHTGADTNSYDKFHSYNPSDASGAGSWRNFHYSNFYKVSAGNNTLSLRVNNYFGSGHYLAINGAGISGFYVPKNYL